MAKTFIEAVLDGFEVPKGIKRTYAAEIKDCYKNAAKAVIVKHGGKITNCFHCYYCYRVEYTATKEQVVEIRRELVNLDLLDEKDEE